MTDQIPPIEVTYPELNVLLDGRYQVIEILAAKAWMRTYLAQDLHRPSKSECLIRYFKTIPTASNYLESIEGLFAGEAAALEHLGTHAQIPQLLAYFQDSNGFYTVHEWIDGTPLAVDLRSQERWSAAAVVELLQAVLNPLVFVHQSGSIHGNLKPNHLLRRKQDGQWIVVDFSGVQQIQLALSAVCGLESSAIAGQSQYQPPEQLQGLVCPASDVYALGMIAIQALTGIEPANFSIHPQTSEILWKEHVASEASTVQQTLIAVLEGMVQRDITKRFATAYEVQMALEDGLREAPKADPTVWVLAPTIKEDLQRIEEQPREASIRNGAENPPEVVVDPPVVPVTAIATVSSEAASPYETALTIASSNQLVRVFGKQSLVNVISNPSVRVSAGGMAVAATFAAVGWGLLNSVDWADSSMQVGQAKSQAASDNPKFQSSDNLLQRWGKQWQQGSLTYQKAELALNQKRWAEAQQLATKMPDVPYWREQGKRLTQRAIAQAEPESFQRLQAAYQSAKDKNFTKALEELKQIVPGTSVETIAQTKLAEYREKQNIKAAADLQKAYDRAIIRDFTKALAYLYQIPEGTSAYETSQQKITEYKQKEKIRAQALLQAADTRANQKEFIAAISLLETLPPEWVLSPEVESRINAYSQQLNAHANQTFELATQQIESGNSAAAIKTLKNVPLGTSAYAQARDRLTELMGQPLQTIQEEGMNMRQVSTQQSSTLNPGDRLQGI